MILKNYRKGLLTIWINLYWRYDDEIIYGIYDNAVDDDYKNYDYGDGDGNDDYNDNDDLTYSIYLFFYYLSWSLFGFT